MALHNRKMNTVIHSELLLSKITSNASKKQIIKGDVLQLLLKTIKYVFAFLLNLV